MKNYEPIVICGGDTLSNVFKENGIESYSMNFSIKNINYTLSQIKRIIKENEIKEKLEEIRKDQTESPYGMPNSIRREVQLTAEMCRYMREQIDTVFGAGSSQTIFGDVNVPTMFGEFFTLIGPCISSARSGAVKKYTAKKKATPK